MNKDGDRKTVYCRNTIDGRMYKVSGRLSYTGIIGVPELTQIFDVPKQFQYAFALPIEEEDIKYGSRTHCCSAFFISLEYGKFGVNESEFIRNK